MGCVRQFVRNMQPLALSLLVLLSAPGPLFAAQLVGDALPKLRGQPLIEQLKTGGYVIYFRHGLTNNTSEKNVAHAGLEDCAIQRNLSHEGRAQTKAIGTAFRTLQIPVGDVYASPYCRTMDTAINIFGKAQKSHALHFAIQLDHAKRSTVTMQLLALLATVPQPGRNSALVSHTANLQEAMGIWPKPEGVAHIFKPEGSGQLSYVGMVLPAEWTTLAAQMTTAAGGQGWFEALKQRLLKLF